MNTYEIRTSRITYDFYQIEANSLEEAEGLALCRNDKVNSFTTAATPDYCKEVKQWHIVTYAGTSMKNTAKRWGTPKIATIVYKTINPIAITIGTHHQKNSTIGEIRTRTLIVCVKSVLISPTTAKK